MNLRPILCRDLSGNILGYLGTYNAWVYMEPDRNSNAVAWCKWHIKNASLYLVKDTEPQNRWLGNSEGNACWGLTEYSALVVNKDRTISLSEYPQKRLAHDTSRANGYLHWSNDASDEGIVIIDVPPPCSWLDFIAGDTYISAINLPGTHDSAAINTYTRSLWACQDKSITGQLEGGIRVLDVRVKVNNDLTFDTCHGDVGLGMGANVYQSLLSLLDECKVFLSAHDSEFIVMSIKVDDWNGLNNYNTRTVLKSVLSNYALFSMHSVNKIPQLQDVRGKIFILDRADLNIGLLTKIPDPAPGNLLKPDNIIFVQDKYENYKKTPEVEKFDLFQAAAKYLNGSNKNQRIVLNFASGTQGVGNLSGVYIQKEIIDWLSAEEVQLTGWSLFDYPFKSFNKGDMAMNCAELIIQSNFGYIKLNTSPDNSGKDEH